MIIKFSHPFELRYVAYVDITSRFHYLMKIICAVKNALDTYTAPLRQEYQLVIITCHAIAKKTAWFGIR